MTVALTQTPLHWASYNVAYTYSAAQGTGNGANYASIEDAMRRFSFTGVLHTSPDAGSTLWQHISHGLVLSGSSDYISRKEFAGLNFINLNARLTKDLMVGSRFRLQAVVQTFNMMTRTNNLFSKAMAVVGEGDTGVFQAYTRVAEVQSPDNTEGGLRLTF